MRIRGTDGARHPEHVPNTVGGHREQQIRDAVARRPMFDPKTVAQRIASQVQRGKADQS